MSQVGWHGLGQIRPHRYVCGYCGADVASEKGWPGAMDGNPHGAAVAICPNCTYPSFLTPSGIQVPGRRHGNDVGGITEASVASLYNEARQCVANGAPTSAVLACRTLLMHIAVSKGAKEGDSFVSYVDFLASKGFVPPDGKEWVDHIRQMGNQANHQIVIATPDGAEELISFVEMLLKFIFEFPARVRARKPSQPTP